MLLLVPCQEQREKVGALSRKLGPSDPTTETATGATAATATAATAAPAYSVPTKRYYVFDHVSDAATAPPATVDSATRSQWLSRDAAARLAIRNHLPIAECAHFGQHRTAQALYDAVVARYSSPATAALGHLLLPYLFPELSVFTTVKDLVSHLRASDARYRAAIPAEFLDRNLPPMFITLYFIVTRLPESLRSVRDHFLSLDPTSLTVDLLEQHLLAAETSAVADIGAASASAKRRSSKGKGGKGGGVGSGGGGGGSGSSGGGRSGGGCGGGTGGGSGGSGGGGGSSGGSGGGGGSGTGGGGTGARRVGSGGGQRQQQQRQSETQSPQQLREWFLRGASGGSCPYVIRTGSRAGHTCGRFHTQHRCFSRLDDAWRAEFGDDVELPRWADLLRSRIAIFDLDFDAILSAMYALSVSAEGDCYRCVPPDPGIAAAALGASESGTLPGTAPAQALHTFTLDSGASACFFRDSTTLTPLSPPDPIRLVDPSRGPVVARSSTVLPCPAVPSGSLSGLHLLSFSTNLVSTAALQDAMVTTTTPGGQRVTICMCTQTGHHLATFSRWPGSTLYTLDTEPPQVAASAQVSASGQVAASCSCRLLSHQTLLWHNRLGHPSLPRLRGMHSRLLVSGLPRSLPPLPPSPAPPCLLCVEGRQRAAPHSSSFPLTTAPLQTLHMDVWGLARVSGQSRKRYFLLVDDDYMWYTTIFPSRSKGQVVDLLIPWIRTVRLQLRERFGQDLPVLRLHSDRGGEFSSNLLREFCHGEVIEVPCTSMIHAAAPHFLWLFAVQYAAHQLNLWPRVSLPETSPTLRWTGEVGDASMFRVRGSRAFVRDTSADKLSPHAIPCGLAPLGVSHVDPLPGPVPVQVAVGSGAARGAMSGGAEPWGAESEGAETGEGAESGGAEPEGAASSRGSAGASPRQSPQQMREWFVRRTRLRSGATGTGGVELLELESCRDWGVEGARAGVPTESGAPVTGGSGAGGTRVGGAGGAGVGDTGAGGARAGGAGAVDPGGAVRPRPRPLHFLLLLLTLRRPAVLQSVVSLRLVLSRMFTLLVAFLVRVLLLSRHARYDPSSFLFPLRVPLPTPPESSLPTVPDPESDRARATSPTISHLFARAVSDPSFQSAAASALVAELLAFAAACRLNYATALVAESASVSPPFVGGECALGTNVLEDKQEEFECIAAAVPRCASMLLAAMDAEMASWKSTGTYVDEVPPRGANIVDGMWIFRVKRPSGSPLAFKARYVARGFSQRQGVDYFETFSPTPKMTTLRVLLHVAAQRDYELHTLDFSTTFLQGSLHEEIWLRRPPGFTGLFPAGTQWSLRRPVYGLRLAPREWHDTLKTTLAALRFAHSTADPSLFLRTDTSLPPFYVLVYDDDLVFATADTEALTLVKSELQKRHTCTDLGKLRSYLGLQITWDSVTHVAPSASAFRLPVLLAAAHSSVYQPLALSSTFGRVRRAECTSGMGLVLGGRGPVVLTGHADTSWVDDSATQRSSQGYTFSLGSGSVSWRSTHSSSVLSSYCEAEIYAGAMAAQELRWLTYLLTDLGEQPRSPPHLYVDNKAMIALCQEHRLEHRTKHIALRYFLAQGLQQRGQLRQRGSMATRANTADIFTKALPRGDHQRFSTVLGLVPTLPHFLIV
ncbi:unnamed protein product [Closterium sp. NIES-54]